MQLLVYISAQSFLTLLATVTVLRSHDYQLNKNLVEESEGKNELLNKKTQKDNQEQRIDQGSKGHNYRNNPEYQNQQSINVLNYDEEYHNNKTQQNVNYGKNNRRLFASNKVMPYDGDSYGKDSRDGDFSKGNKSDVEQGFKFSAKKLDYIFFVVSFSLNTVVLFLLAPNIYRNAYWPKVW